MSSFRFAMPHRAPASEPVQTRGRTNNRKLFALLVLSASFILLTQMVAISEMQMGPYLRENGISRNSTQFKHILEGEPIVRSKPKILIYTKFFGSRNWYLGYKDFEKTCIGGCTLTDDISEIETADAVVFHLGDIAWQATGYFQAGSGLWFKFPEYRRPDQVWLLYNLEPLTMIWGNMGAWQGQFNWTWSYNRASDVTSPYGGMQPLTPEQSAKAKLNPAIINADYFKAKSSDGGIAMISHCTDDARRFRIITTLQKYIPIRVVGRCGEGCPDGYGSCSSLLQDYKFYLAFENSDCYDYVSEKYWRSLERRQIPIVAWKLNMSDLVIPGSFINVYDFPNIDEAGRYIQRVNNNQTLYNSYFSWKTTHALHYGEGGMCTLCRKLQDAHAPRMVYHDMEGWINNNTCKPMSLLRYAHRIFDRVTHDFRV